MSIKYKQIAEPLTSRLDKMFGVKNAMIEVHPGRVLIPPKFQDIGQRILDLDVRPDDIWICGYPRTGSTWTLEMVWCIVNNLDFETALSVGLNFRSPIIELMALFGNDIGVVASRFPDSVGMVEALRSPRCVRSHLPPALLPTQLSTVKPKVVYVARNPKDVCVSYYHYCQLLHDLNNCSFDEFCQLFLEGKVLLGSYLDHVEQFWKLRNEDNVLFLKYEDMIKDHKAGVQKLASFLGKNLSKEDIQRVVDHASFKKMQVNPSVNLESVMEHMQTPAGLKFIRRGQVGDWRNYMSDSMSRKFEDWVERRLGETGLCFEYS